MLSMGQKKLYFPNLVMIESNSERRHCSDLYRLDWTSMEDKLRQRHEQWRKQCWPDKGIPFISPVPNEFKGWCDNLVFAINRNYLSEIRRMAQAALGEWAAERSFDTTVRETCLRPAIAFAWCSFYLLADCVYDQDTQYFSRVGEDEVARYILSFRFWCHQTGRGLIWRNSGMEDLQRAVSNRNGTDDFLKAGEKWLQAAKDHLRTLNAAYDCLSIEQTDEK